MKALRMQGLWITISGVLIAACAWSFRLRFPFDDTFITLRYAEHLASGHGFVWNIGGPHTEGFTNFLFVIVLAISRVIASDLLAAAQIVGLLSTIVTGVLLYRIGKHWRNDATGIVACALFFATPLTWINALSGMETSFFDLLAVFSLYFFSVRRLALGFAAALLATLTRPEAGLIAVIAFVIFLFTARQKREVWTAAISAYALPLLAYALWKYFYFGELLPNSFYIKVSEVRSVLPGLQYVRLFVTSCLLLIVLSAFIRGRSARIFTAASWAACLLLFFVFVLPLEGLYDRFLWPAFAVLCVTAATGIHDITARQTFLRFSIVAPVLIVAHFGVSLLTPRTNQAFAAHEDIWDRSMDKIVASLTAIPHHDSLLVGYGDAGYVVYHSGVRHLDLFGLNDTRIAHAKTPQERAAVITSENPDLLLLPVRQNAGCAELVEDAYGVARSDQYHPVAAIDAFPYTLIYFLNERSPFYAEMNRMLGQMVSNELQAAPTICQRTR